MFRVTMIPLKRKMTFLGQQTYRLNAPKPRVRSSEQRSKRHTQDREQHSKRRIQERVTLECMRARSAEEIFTLARERYRLSLSN